jgi:hypothetical protein
MKMLTSLYAGLLLTGWLAVANATDQNGIIEKVPFTAGSYCHEKFHAMEGRTLGTANPVLKNDGDVIDFYGPCDESPTGKDQKWEQELDREHRFQQDYEE